MVVPVAAHKAERSLWRVRFAKPLPVSRYQEGYEGLLVSKNREQDLVAVREFIESLLHLTKIADTEQLFEADTILLSAGGSTILIWSAVASNSNCLYRVLSHRYCVVDVMSRTITVSIMTLYKKWKRVKQVSKASSLRPALEVWSMVQSRPEADLAISPWANAMPHTISIYLCRFAYYQSSMDDAPATLPTGCKVENEMMISTPIWPPAANVGRTGANAKLKGRRPHWLRHFTSLHHLR